jgi:4-aminobutyrate--pyruvate transaminase
LAAVLFSEAVYAVIADNSAKIGTFGHGFTTSGHPLATAVALENLKILEERDLTGQAARVGAFMQKELGKLAAHPLVGEVRGTGLIAGIELVEDKASKRIFEPQLKVGLKAFGLGHQNGLIVRAIGDTIALCPPLIITEAQVQEMIARLKKTLDDTAAALAADGQLQKRYA